MKSRKLHIIIFIIAVLGLFVVQYQYLRIGLNLAKVQFSKNIGTVSRAIKIDLAEENELTFLIGKSISMDDSYFNLSLDSVQNASGHFLNDFLKDRLAVNGIAAEFSYQLFSRDSTDYLTSPIVFEKEDKLNAYPIELEGYLPALIGKSLVLELQFKDINTYFLFQLNGLTIPSLIFIFAIIMVVIWVLSSFYWQGKLITTTNEFINNLTHELKTPVFAIGLATKILEEDLDEKHMPIIVIIRQQIERLKVHIDKVLELGGMEHNKNALVFKDVDFRSNLQRLCEEFQTLGTLESLQFSYEIENGEYPVHAAASHLENAIINLLENAKKYSEDPKIQLKAFIEQKYLKVSVKDNGIGLDKKDQQRIFNKYYRVNQGNLHTVKGYGLGLHYVKHVVDSHKGHVKVDSEVGIGTTISLLIPLKKNEKRI
ncbi:HAMP domain-containing sensor histidine kinase [Flavobacteriaceae bacterium KMM 6897]|nr:HAMP domain-containing sensor histidine kinase [Flavobacteriaceae bacterium KMM 6897]